MPDSTVPDARPSARRGISVFLLAAATLAWLGAGICFLLWQQHSGLRAFLCPAAGSCEKVLTSRYSSAAGIPLPILGGAYYVGLLSLVLIALAAGTVKLRIFLLHVAHWIAIVALTFSAGLMVLQFVVLRAFCPLCTLSAVITLALVVVLGKSISIGTTNESAASPAIAITLFFFALLPMVLLSAPTTSGTSATLLSDLSTAHLTGPSDARVRLVVFSDFDCPFCQRLAPTLERIRQEFPNEVSLAFRSYPLDSHPRAFPAAVAAECAAEQGKFWEYHDALFSGKADLSDAGLSALAASLGLDTARFAGCLKSGKARDRVEASRLDAIQSGLEGTPVLFFNGRRVQNGLDYEHLAQRIRDSLHATPTPSP